MIPVLDAYNSAHQAGNAEEAFAHLATLDVVLAYESGYSGYYFHGFSSPEELALAIEKSVGEHGRLSTWRVDEISYSYQERQGGGYHLVFADVWRTYDDGYVGKFVFLLVKHEGRYLIIGMDETSY